MKLLLIAFGLSLVSAVLTLDASAMVTPANGCVDNKCAVEALLHKNDKGETIFADRSVGAYVALVSNEGVIVSGPDYGPSNPRQTYSA